MEVYEGYFTILLFYYFTDSLYIDQFTYLITVFSIYIN